MIIPVCSIADNVRTIREYKWKTAGKGPVSNEEQEDYQEAISELCRQAMEVEEELKTLRYAMRKLIG